MAKERSPIKVPSENEDLPDKENASDFDEDTLRATANVYRNEGNEAFKKGDFINAIHFYTKGIKMNCNEKELKAKLYNNRAIAHSKLGNHQDSLRDAEAAIELNPTFLKAIVRGATACVELKRFEEAITWCNKGLAINKNHRILLSLRLQSVSEVGDKSMEEKDPISHDPGSASSGDVRKVVDLYNQGEEAIEYHNLHLKIAKEVGDKHGEGVAYGNLGNPYHHLGDSKKAIEYYNLNLKIAKEVGDKHGEGNAYGNLGIAYHRLGNFKKALEYHNLYLKITKEVGDKHGEGGAYGNLGSAYFSLGDFKKAIEYHNLHLKIAKEVGDKHAEGAAYGNLGNPYYHLGDSEKAIEYYNLNLKIAKEVGDKHGEGNAYGNLGNTNRRLGNFKKALKYHNLHLKITKEVGDKHGEGDAYGNCGNDYFSLGDFKKAIEYHNLHLKIAKEVGDKHGEGGAYGNLGMAYRRLADFKKAIEHYDLHLKIAQEVGDKLREGNAYGNLGNAYFSLGDFKKAIENHNRHLEIAKEVEDKDGEGMAHGNLGNVYYRLGDSKKAIEQHNQHLKIAKEVGDKHGEGSAYGNLGNAYDYLGDSKKAIDYHNLDLKIAKEVGDKHGEGGAYSNLGIAYRRLGDFKKAIKYHNLHLLIAKEVGDKFTEAMAYCLLAWVFELQGRLPKAVEHYQASINLFNSLRVLLISKDEWKVNFRNQHQVAYTGLWRVLVEQGNVDEALFVAEKGRAQALTDLMESSFCGGTSHHKGEDEDCAVLKNVPPNTVFQAVDKANVYLWVGSEGKQVQLRQSKLKGFVSENSGSSLSFKSFMLGVYTQLGVLSNVRCENRSLDALREGRSEVDEKTKEAKPQPHIQQDGCLSTLYDIVMKPVADLIEGDELLIIPDGPLWIVPYAALKDGNSKYLCESFTIRVAPSLASLRLIADCPDDYHKSSDALLVGDPWISEVTNSEGEQLPCAKEEVEMIGKILNIMPITGRQATKREVLKRLSSVSLVHFAAHGCMETGQIALTPDPDRISTVPTEEDYMLTIGDVLNAQLRAKLVVLSCCHSGRGEIKAEGVVGIARAFMGAGARSIVVSLWAIDDEATLEFMKHFYQQLAGGKPASESLNLAMKSLRESDKFCDIKYWAPFLLIGDDVTLDFMTKERENLNMKSHK
ncbi:tetratricopeptide repeat protein 28 isoform X1 [Pocillopora verrucosa]|uniref:tetratricopeptide repeat protein 28 isoform X1 n=1 Tax=Pocillopora verrucosa TaxID=203993 RepID=UPI00333E6F09